MTLLALDAFLLIEKLALIVIIVFATLGVALYTTFAERKVAAILQDRPNSNRAGSFGLLQPFTDGVKMFTKEEIIPTHASKWLFILGQVWQ
jgi:NADH-quinone oxidoreductase subunit H